MASITQDMRYRLSLIRYAEKHGVSKTARKYKPIANIFTAGKNVMMAPGTLFATVPDVPILIPASIPMRKSVSSATCGAEILIPV